MPLKLVRRHGSPTWYLRGSVRGIPVDKSTRTDNREAADAIRIKEEQRLLDLSIFGERATVTFLQAAVSFMESGGEARFMEPLLKHFGTRKLNSIGQADVDAAARSIYPGRKPSTHERQVYAPTSAVLRHGAKRQWCDFIVLERPSFDNARIRHLSHAQANRLVSGAADHLKPLLIFLLGTGARLSEALYLQWSEVDLTKSHVTFANTKNGDNRGVPLSDKVVEALAALPNRVGPVFLSDDGKPYKRRENGGGLIKTAFKTACRNADIPDFHPHDCRHTWATWHYAANRDLVALQTLGGWKSHEMVLRYAHVNVQNLRDGIKAMGW